MGPPFTYEGGRKIYFPPEAADRHTQWPFAPDDEAAMNAFIAGYGPLPSPPPFLLERPRLLRGRDAWQPLIELLVRPAEAMQPSSTVVHRRSAKR